MQRSEDYFFLRQKGIEYIEQMGSQLWTDYNSHDPGITMLEALCYGITDLGFRTGWDIKDLLAEPPGIPADHDLQALFTARNILTTNPLTVDDYRRLLIDMDRVRNAWLVCRENACEVGLYGNCKKSKLAYRHPAGQEKVVKVTPKGTYDVLLEMENDPELGDLNDRKLRQQFIVNLGTKRKPDLHALVVEIHFPEQGKLFWDTVFTSVKNAEGTDITITPKEIKNLKIDRLARNVTGDEVEKNEIPNWRHLFYITLKVTLMDGSSVWIRNATMRLFGRDELLEKLTCDKLKRQLRQKKNGAPEIVSQYFQKMATVEETIFDVKHQLHQHRNLAEDFCCTGRVCVQDVAVCADVEVAPDADIERVLAKVLFEIENYFNPAVRFYSLREMMEQKVPVEKIFEGPQLKHGFIRQADLDRAQLKTQLRTSDIINQLVEIEGIIAVKNLLLTRYDDEGKAVRGVADQHRENKNPNQLSARWTLDISEQCQPRLYVDNSKFLFFKNGLPFLARTEEVHATLQQLRGESERLKIKDPTAEQLDLLVPEGTYRNPESYYPVQYSFPLTYGIGPVGLPSGASDERKAQAKQLKAFLLFFEQLLGNQLVQVANVKNLFSVNPPVGQTYFTKNLRSETLIQGSETLIDAKLDEAALQRLVESEPEYLDRRNRFLDHLLGRFAESFTDYALAMYSLQDKRPLAQSDLIDKKSKFLQDYPSDSFNRGRAINYHLPLSDGDYAGLRSRIASLLGLTEEVEKQIFIIEHLLLRPRYPGDTLMPVCLDETCTACGEEDPYSFQLTIVMPGWAKPFDRDVELRRFADRTIRLETPAHLMVKICWVGNVENDFNPCYPHLIRVADLLCDEGEYDTDELKLGEQVASDTEKLWAHFKAHFEDWFAGREQEFFDEVRTEQQLKILFDGLQLETPENFAASNLANLKKELDEHMAAHFATVAAYGKQHSRIRKAWESWLEVAGQVDWCEVSIRTRLDELMIEIQREKVERRLERPLKPEEVQAAKDASREVLEKFGAVYHRLVTSKLGIAPVPDDMTKWVQLIFLGEKSNGTENEEKKKFKGIYPDKKIKFKGIRMVRGKDFTEVMSLFESIFRKEHLEATKRLKRLIGILSNLSSVYPTATLHDCDDGSDDNPVRLSSTTLGG